MDNQNYDPINSQEVGNVETPSTTETTAESTPILNQEVAEAKTFNFTDALDVDYRNNPSIQKFNNVNDMAKSYINLEGMLGKEKAVIPQDLSDSEAIADYMSKIGRPENIDGYNLNYDAESMGRELDLNSFKEVALANNMTDAQAQGLINWYADNLKSAMVNESEQRQESIAQAGVELRKEWGSAYDEKISKAKSFFESNFSSLKDSTELMEAVGNNPAFIRDLSKLAGKFSEADIGDIPKQVTLTPVEAKSERAKLMTSESYTNYLHPEHQATVEKARELLKIQMSGQA